jgi:hypothetical protein
MEADQHAEYVAGDCRLWDFVGLNSWRCLCGRAYERGTNKRQTHLDDLSGPMTHNDGPVPR